MATIRYRVTLTKEEREELHEISHNGKRAARVVLNSLILLAVDESDFQDQAGKSERAIADTLRISPTTINNLKKRFVEDGFELALERKTSPPRRLKYDGDFQAHLTALACSEAPDGQARWSLRLLADKVVELNYTDNISHETVRRILKKANSNPGKRKNG